MRVLTILTVAVVFYGFLLLWWKREVDRRLDAYRDAVLHHAACALRSKAAMEFQRDGWDSARGAGIWDAGCAIDPYDGNLLAEES